ncbi:L-allo-threonine aldolase [bioreactor metagenome]
MLCGTKEFISQALTVRKLLGGGMRQTGILAAAGLYALEHHVDRLKDDHAHAKAIADTLVKTGWADVDVQGVQTNIIFFTVPTFNAQDVVKQLARIGILANTEGETVRLVTNLDLSDEDTQSVCSLLASFNPEVLA